MIEESNNSVWKTFLQNHWQMLALFIVIGIAAVIGAIYVFLWFVGEAQATAMVPTTLGLWTMGNLITFILHLLAREILFIGVPVLVIIALIYFGWWKRLPIEERNTYKKGHLFGKKSHSRDGGGAISFMINIFVIFKVYLDGNWDLAFGEWTVDYLVNSYLTALLWVAIIFGIPIILGVIYWIHRKITK